MWSPAQRSDELYHWIPFRGSREKHKYIAKVQEGKHTRYFYTQEEYDAYKNLKDKQANPSRTEPRGLVAKAKHFVDYDLTGVGYRRDARQKNKEIDELKKLKSDNPLQADKDKLKEYSDRNKRIRKKYKSEVDEIDEKLNTNKNQRVNKQDWEDVRKANELLDREKVQAKENRNRQLDYSNKAREEYKYDAKRKNLAEQLAADREKKANTEQAEKDFKEKSLVGKTTKVGDFIKNFNRNLEDQKTAKWMKKNADYAQQWMKDLGIDKSVYDPSKEANSSKLKKYLRRNKNSGNGAVSDLRDGESLKDYFERKGYVTKEKGKIRYHKQKQNRRKDSASLKHSDEEFLGLEIYTEELYHYGRKGMKWYQHIYGPVQSIAKYAKKAGSKMADAKANHDVKEEAKWEVKKEKIIRSGNAKAVRKISDKLTDDELRRADNRINEKNRLDSMTGRQQQGQQNQNNNQQKYKEPSDLLNDFNKWANNAVKTYNNIDSLIKTVDDLKKYTPEGRAKEAEKKRIIGENDVDAFLSNLSMFNDNEKKAFNQVGIAINQVRERERAKYEASKQTPDFGPQTLTQQTKWKDYVDSMDIKYGSATPSQKRTDPLLNESNSVSLWEKALDEAKRTPVSESELQQAYEHILDEQRRR